MNRRRLLQAVLGICLVCLSWVVSPLQALAMGGAQIPLGDPAPDFTLPTNAGDGEVSLADFRDQWVVLYFYPRDFTSGCTIEAQRFERDIAEYQARNAQIIGISADSVESHAEFCDAEGLEFPLLSDPKGTVSKAYGSWLGAVSLRHTYIIGPDGTMQARFLGVQPVIHSREVLAELDKLQQAA
ncbi:peroxiredoxin [Nodosilinea sp. LEGE 06152]|uniref:peroxiredoxin n=1 Tax=Nodosilinea sp. LEGE 06152 TaxID=2777966 RepID=UPI0018813DD4|nr:peroxiredoxin [Nodosilinea sp. LEGE 06152]MBE9159991.1 peroxiredoxin [Nodosilinea sp. LEGE 06152]